jgi:predicted P-loop ATPase
MADNIFPFPALPAEQAKANKDRSAQLFDWARTVLKDLGITQAIKDASSLEELRSITLTQYEAEIALAIRDALHPAKKGPADPGKPAEYFVGLNAGSLRRIIENQLVDLKKDREKTLRADRQPWEDKLILNKDGTVKPNLANLVLILRESPHWKGVFGYDDFNNRVVIRSKPPWGWGKDRKGRTDTPLSDHHETQTRVWFQREYRINPTLGDVGRAVQAAAKARSFHPVRDYFGALKWDGKPRLDMWLVRYFHAEDSDYIRAIGPRWLLSSVARIFEPGCKADHVLVLEGPQGKRKSDALRTVAVEDAWFSDRLSHMGTKDAMIDVAGTLIIELSELEALARAASSTTKSFITSQTDKFRPPHGKHRIAVPRQCVFAGTINPPIGGYLKDATGARRFWPVECIGSVDSDGLKRDRDQLWAEAVSRYRAGEKWWLETPELEALATAEQAARFKVDIWEEPITAWLRRGKRDDITVWEVVEGALGYPTDKASQSIVNRVQKVLTRIGFRQHRVVAKDRPGREVRYRLDPVAAPDFFLPDQPDDPDHPTTKPKTTKTTKTTKRSKRR